MKETEGKVAMTKKEREKWWQELLDAEPENGVFAVPKGTVPPWMKGGEKMKKKSHVANIAVRTRKLNIVLKQIEKLVEKARKLNSVPAGKSTK